MKDPWRFSDGTIVELGGEITGQSDFAESLRHQLESGSAFAQVWAPPGGDFPVKPNDPALVDRWLRDELDRLTRAGEQLRLLSAPVVPALPLPPWYGKELHRGAVY